MNEKQLIEQCLKGERKAQRGLFDNYYKYVYTICHRYVQHHQDAEDVVSEVFRRVFKNLGSIKVFTANGLKKWIQTISINESLRFIKRKNPIDYIDEELVLSIPVSQDETKVLPDMNRIKAIINTMPDGYRTIFLLNVVDGLSHTEIAEHLSINRNTSKSQMLKARKFLQQKFRNNESRQLG